MDNLLKFNVSLYTDSPAGTELLYKHVEMLYHRLSLYQIFRAKQTISLQELKTELGDNPLKHLLEVEDNEEVKSARRLDYITHWTLKVAYSDEHPSFFIGCELRWFKIRFNNMPHDQRMEFIRHNNLTLTSASDEEKANFNFEGRNWYKFDFREVTSLVKLRLYPMHRGLLFVPEHKLVFWLIEKLQNELQTSLLHCRKMLSSACEQMKLLLSSYELVKPINYTGSKNFKLQDLDKNAQRFPLCMKFLYENLKKDHHLKYDSRVQYGLFLKGLGISLQEALEMWEQEFTHKMTEQRFAKGYRYFFKHQYGTVGSKINYEAQSCDTIIEQYVQSGFIHGCPFKHWDRNILSDRLVEDNVRDEDFTKIIDFKQREQYKAACTAYLQSVHGCKPDETINHPIMYYEKSCCRSVGLVDIEDLFLSDED